MQVPHGLDRVPASEAVDAASRSEGTSSQDVAGSASGKVHAGLPPVVAARLASVDALRGCTVAAMLLVNNPGDWSHIFGPLRHADWHGWTVTDLIFPFFLFIVGTSLALSLGARLEDGRADHRAMRRSVVLRGMRVLLLGLALNALAWWLLDRPALRWPGVLQRIGLCIALTGVIVTWPVMRSRAVAVLSVLMVGYAALLLAGGTLVPELDIASRVDAWLFGPHGYRWNAQTGLGRDPEGLVSTLGALSTTLLGFVLGDALRRGQVKRVLGIGLALAVCGWGLDAVGAMPINKALWTPSFVLWTGGLAAIALATSHWLVDVKDAPPLGRRFGVNAIAAYAGAWLGSILLAASGWMQWLYGHVFGALLGGWGPKVQSLGFALTVVAVWWLVMVVLDRRRIYLKL